MRAADGAEEARHEGRLELRVAEASAAAVVVVLPSQLAAFLHQTLQHTSPTSDGFLVGILNESERNNSSENETESAGGSGNRRERKTEISLSDAVSQAILAPTTISTPNAVSSGRVENLTCHCVSRTSSESNALIRFQTSSQGGERVRGEFSLPPVETLTFAWLPRWLASLALSVTPPQKPAQIAALTGGQEGALRGLGTTAPSGPIAAPSLGEDPKQTTLKPVGATNARLETRDTLFKYYQESEGGKEAGWGEEGQGGGRFEPYRDSHTGRNAQYAPHASPYSYPNLGTDARPNNNPHANSNPHPYNNAQASCTNPFTINGTMPVRHDLFEGGQSNFQGRFQGQFQEGGGGAALSQPMPFSQELARLFTEFERAGREGLTLRQIAAITPRVPPRLLRTWLDNYAQPAPQQNTGNAGVVAWGTHQALQPGARRNRFVLKSAFTI